MKKITILVVDDSALIRKILVEIFNSDERLEVVGTAADPLIARDKIKQLNPDVLTLDIEMPRMDGLTFLKNLMRLRPMPVVMISTLTNKGANITLDALEIGAVDYFAKPVNDNGHQLAAYSAVLIEKVVQAAGANVRTFDPSRFQPRPYEEQADIGKLKPDTWIAIGASTGGTEAIREVIQNLPAQMPPIVVTQHIPYEFSGSYAERLNRCCSLEVHHVVGGELIQPGHVYLAPGNAHLRFARKGGRWVCRLDEGERVNRHRPSVEVMFDSAGEAIGRDLIAVMLTGMGADGAEAMLRLRQQGCRTIAQNEESSVVWGMPGAAVALGAAVDILPLQSIGRTLIKYSH
ncbi:protein-glutamate methylesterase/protein-glutamine glutaminase [Gynuella sunshinyii]|uniref:Protein-glutamate methylesterase/protein-glutamine glutaminase n=1 Tax=Gynuella sunshinyii YC6258 TaxID=1445510 RepID=A0A0C5VAH8_9GAMM|nr:chemotaxis response regulator protein-glutamate methylesterase [Gynuella sunshinyii]AJQ96325.1 chemotaxis response regulator containing a CheY-like receiver domain and a methylesterase domain [Gynuella sunshinyii YC6258]